MLAAVFGLGGCGAHEEITTYTVPTHESLQTSTFLEESAARKPHDERILGAIAPMGPAMWFFKLQGPPDAVAARESEFREFLKTVRFPTPERVTWMLPDGWREKPGNEMRYATLVIPGEPPLEVSVTTLPGGEGDPTQRLLANINRWRNQLDLPLIEAEDLPARSEAIKLDELILTIVNYVGKAKPNAMMPGAMAAGGMAKRAERPRESSAKMQYEVPEGWNEVQPLQMTMHTFEIKGDEKSATVTISRAGGSQSANVNRWRGQVGLEPLSDGEISQSLTKWPVGTLTGDFVEMAGKDAQGRDWAILGLMIPDGDRTVFVKLAGDPKLAARERMRFEAFAKSLKF